MPKETANNFLQKQLLILPLFSHAGNYGNPEINFSVIEIDTDTHNDNDLDASPENRFRAWRKREGQNIYHKKVFASLLRRNTCLLGRILRRP